MTINLHTYQKFSPTTAIYPHANTGNTQELMYLALGLMDESGEVGGKIKKLYRDGSLNKEQLVKEMGDVFWYLSQLANAIDVKLEDVLNINVIKLTTRKQQNTIKGEGDNR